MKRLDIIEVVIAGGSSAMSLAMLFAIIMGAMK